MPAVAAWGPSGWGKLRHQDGTTTTTISGSRTALIVLRQQSRDPCQRLLSLISAQWKPWLLMKAGFEHCFKDLIVIQPREYYCGSDVGGLDLDPKCHPNSS